MKREIITIDEKACTGCGLCIPNCPEGALQIIDGKARLVSDLFCDGLGACVGRCPEGAIKIETKEAEAYDEGRVMDNIAKHGPSVIRAHLDHLASHGEHGYLRQALAYLADHGIEAPEEFAGASCGCGGAAGDEPEIRRGRGAAHDHDAMSCPGSRVMSLEPEASPAARASGETREKAVVEPRPSRLRQWPVQIMLVPTQAPFFDGADIIIAADCVPFAYADFHERLLAGKVLLVGCPKLDDAAHYREKLAEIFRRNAVKSVTVAHMEVPCCFGMVELVAAAIADSGAKVPLTERTISIKGKEI